jgi:hypothetical protein
MSYPSLRFCSSLLIASRFKQGRAILLKLVVLKRKIIGHQDENNSRIFWMSRYMHPPSILSRGRKSVRDLFKWKKDYRTEFEQLLGGNIEDSDTPAESPPWSVSSSQMSPLPSSQATVRQHSDMSQGMQIDENSQKVEGIEFKVPRMPIPGYCPG